MNQELARVRGYLSGKYAKKSLGQHFLISRELSEKIVRSAEINKDDSVLEIGPGLGILTREIMKYEAKKIFLCEKDNDLCELLKNEFHEKNLKIICDDALLLIPNLQAESPLKIISNLPYNISSPVIISVLTASPILPESMVLMLQKEVADRLVSKPGQKNRGLLTVLVELYGSVEIILNVSHQLFYPAPEVESAVIKISNIKPLQVSPKVAIKILKLSFAGKRKKIKNSLFASLKITETKALEIASKCNFSLDERPEDLDPAQWSSLIKELESCF